MGDGIFDSSSLPGCSSAVEFRRLGAGIEVPGEHHHQKLRHQQSLGTSRKRWNMTEWLAGLGFGLGLLKSELDGTYD